MSMLACRLCQSKDFFQFLDLGFTPPADQFRRLEQLKEPETAYPLRVVRCNGCGFIQLDHVVSPEILYRNDYPYESSTTKTGYRHWDSFADAVVSRYGLDQDDLVVDIGSNVGVLLEAFKRRGLRVAGVDPAANIVLLAQQRGIDTICDFFNAEAVSKLKAQFGNASIVTGTNVFAHIDDLDELVRNVFSLLNPEGVFIFEAPYFGNLLDKVEFDTIYHEHLSYISLSPLLKFFNRHGLEVIDLAESDIHGGSVRIFVAKRGVHVAGPEVERFLERERSSAIIEDQTLRAFAEKVADNRWKLMSMLYALKGQGKRIVAVSAPAKGMTLLNYCRIGPELIDYVTEKSQLKIGRFTPGTHIPVYSDDRLLEDMPDYALLLAWNFAEEIMSNLSEFRNRGGKFILPVPEPRVVSE